MKRALHLSHGNWFIIVLPLLTAELAALDISLSYSDGFKERLTAVAAMEQAAAAWERALWDPIIVDIDVREPSAAELPFPSLAVTVIDWYEATYSDFRTALVADVNSANDASTAQHLPSGPQVKFQAWDQEGKIVIHDGNHWINNWIAIPRANATALGLRDKNDRLRPDAEIVWNSFLLDDLFDYDRSDGIDGIDFIAVALHEIGHALGFVSGADAFDYVFAGQADLAPEELLNEEWSVISPLDLFRYSVASMPLPDVTPGVDAYFSIDGGVTSLGRFATGEFFGDGLQAGHWRDNSDQGVMEGVVGFFEIDNLTDLDLITMDVIGWNIAADPKLSGDFNVNGMLDAEDIDLLSAVALEGRQLLEFDLNGDTTVDEEDRRAWVHVLKRTYFGDANLDGQFNTSDLAAVWGAGKYETADEAGWATGDWNGDRRFRTSDLAIAFAQGGFELGLRAALPVPEPGFGTFLGITLLALSPRLKKKKRKGFVQLTRSHTRRLMNES